MFYPQIAQNDLFIIKMHIPPFCLMGEIFYTESSERLPLYDVFSSRFQQNSPQ
jgi:hypothetical protein